MSLLEPQPSPFSLAGLRGRGLRHISIATPFLVLAAAFLGLFLWLQAQDLDPIEEAVLNGPYVKKSIIDHVQLTLVATGIIVVLAVPLGTLLGRRASRGLTGLVLAAGNAGQAVPTIGLVVLLTFWIGIGFKVAIVGMVAYAMLPLLRNTIVAFKNVNPALVEAAQGLGMSSFAVLRQIELPIALPIILAGLRTTVVLNVANATIATFVNAGGLGNIIVNGIQLQRTRELIFGAAAVGLLALILDAIGAVFEEWSRSRVTG